MVRSVSRTYSEDDDGVDAVDDDARMHHIGEKGRVADGSTSSTTHQQDADTYETEDENNEDARILSFVGKSQKKFIHSLFNVFGGRDAV